MTEAEIARFRRRIGDSPKVDSDVAVVEEEAGRSVFDLRFSNASDLTVVADGETVDPADYTLDAENKTVTFDEPQTTGTELRFQYSHVTYTDVEIEALHAEYGFDGAVLEVIEELLVDAARMYDYSQGATKAALSQVFDHLYKLRADLQADISSGGSSGAGGVTVAQRINPRYSTPRRQSPDLSRLEGQ